MIAIYSLRLVSVCVCVCARICASHCLYRIASALFHHTRYSTDVRYIRCAMSRSYAAVCVSFSLEYTDCRTSALALRVADVHAGFSIAAALLSHIHSTAPSPALWMDLCARISTETAFTSHTHCRSVYIHLIRYRGRERSTVQLFSVYIVAGVPMCSFHVEVFVVHCNCLCQIFHFLWRMSHVVIWGKLLSNNILKRGFKGVFIFWLHLNMDRPNHSQFLCNECCWF